MMSPVMPRRRVWKYRFVHRWTGERRAVMKHDEGARVPGNRLHIRQLKSHALVAGLRLGLGGWRTGGQHPVGFCPFERARAVRDQKAGVRQGTAHGDQIGDEPRLRVGALPPPCVVLDVLRGLRPWRVVQRPLDGDDIRERSVARPAVGRVHARPGVGDDVVGDDRAQAVSQQHDAVIVTRGVELLDERHTRLADGLAVGDVRRVRAQVAGGIADEVDGQGLAEKAPRRRRWASATDPRASQPAISTPERPAMVAASAIAIRSQARIHHGRSGEDTGQRHNSRRTQEPIWARVVSRMMWAQ